MELNREVLTRIVSWSAKDNRPVSLGEVVGSRMPEQAARLNIDPYTEKEPFKRVGELDNDEMRKVVMEILSHTSDAVRMSMGRSSYSPEQIREAVRAESDLGRRIIDMNRSEIGMLEQLFETGKVTRLLDGTTPQRNKKS